MARRGIMTKFRIDELSGVDNPAQKGARAVFMKRDHDAQDENRGKGRDEDTDSKVGKTGGDADHEGEDRMSAAIKKALGLPDTATDAEVEAAVVKAAGESSAAAAAIAKANEAAAEAVAKASMTPSQREHYDRLVKADPPKAKDFLGLESKDKDSVCKAWNDGDETCVVEGRTISKRAVGDDMFAILKSQAERIAKNEKAFEKAQEEAANATFAKRASDEFGALAGTTETRAALLKYLDKAPEDVKKTAEEVLKAANGATKAAFKKAGDRELPNGDGSTSIGKGSGVGSFEKQDAEAKLDALTKNLIKGDPKLSYAKAYDVVLSTEEGSQLYDKTLSNPVEE